MASTAPSALCQISPSLRPSVALQYRCAHTLIQHLIFHRPNFTLLSLCTMQVRKQNLTEICDASAIVQPTNQRLNQTGGVSAAICEAAGPPFKQGCAQLVLQEGGSLPRGVARCSYLEPAQRNRLHCQCIIHAVLPLCSGESCDR